MSISKHFFIYNKDLIVDFREVVAVYNENSEVVILLRCAYDGISIFSQDIQKKFLDAYTAWLEKEKYER